MRWARRESMMGLYQLAGRQAGRGHLSSSSLSATYVSVMPAVSSIFISSQSPLPHLPLQLKRFARQKLTEFGQFELNLTWSCHYVPSCDRFFLLRSFICWNKYLSAKDSRFFANSMPTDGITAGPQETWNRWTKCPRGLWLSSQNHSTRGEALQRSGPHRISAS